MFFIAKEREKGTTIEKDMDESIMHYLMTIDLKCAKAMLGYGMLHILDLLENSKLMECVSYIIKAMQIHEEETAIEYAKKSKKTKVKTEEEPQPHSPKSSSENETSPHSGRRRMKRRVELKEEEQLERKERTKH